MILGLGTDLCPSARWAKLLERYGDRTVQRILVPEEAALLLKGPQARMAERLAGRWALREAFGKALGVGMEGWNWRELRFEDGRLWAEGSLAELLRERGIAKLHGSLSHDAGLAFAVVILEGDRF